jgi:hypothetical protein
MESFRLDKKCIESLQEMLTSVKEKFTSPHELENICYAGPCPCGGTCSGDCTSCTGGCSGGWTLG